MKILELQKYTVNPEAPDWLTEALNTDGLLGFGTFCYVLHSRDLSLVVKLSESKADLDAHQALALGSIHFPRTYKRFDNALTHGHRPLHALELERVIPEPGAILKRLIDFLYSKKTEELYQPLSQAASGFRTGEDFTIGLPQSLGLAFEQIITYVASNHGFRNPKPVFDLYRQENWGTRTDGTLVIIDPFNVPFEPNALV